MSVFSLAEQEEMLTKDSLASRVDISYLKNVNSQNPNKMKGYTSWL